MSKLSNGVRTMPKIIAIAIFATASVSCNTGNKIQSGMANSANLDSLLVDTDGNKYPIRVLLDGNFWMTSNLKLSIPGSFCFGNKEDSCNRYGRLYLWESAKRGCSLLGEGWRLPTVDEWQHLSGAYASTAKDSIEARKIAYHSLLYGGSSQFNAVLGGGRDLDGKYARAEAHGFYWTATESDSSAAWFANFAKGSQALYHQKDGEKARAFSVRCVKRDATLK